MQIWGRQQHQLWLALLSAPHSLPIYCHWTSRFCRPLLWVFFGTPSVAMSPRNSWSQAWRAAGKLLARTQSPSHLNEWKLPGQMAQTYILHQLQRGLFTLRTAFALLVLSLVWSCMVLYCSKLFNGSVCLYTTANRLNSDLHPSASWSSLALSRLSLRAKSLSFCQSWKVTSETWKDMFPIESF